MIWTLVIKTYEPSRRFPIVEHHFSGRTKAEANGYYESHLKSDAFLRQCEDNGVFEGGRGDVPCRNTRRWRKKP